MIKSKEIYSGRSKIQELEDCYGVIYKIENQINGKKKKRMGNKKKTTSERVRSKKQ